jgi:hypothetical protein
MSALAGLSNQFWERSFNGVGALDMGTSFYLSYNRWDHLTRPWHSGTTIDHCHF